jgi:thiamine-monophosphate kinase
MLSLESIREFAIISALTKPFSRHPDLVSRQHEADASLLAQPDGSYLALTIDTLLEEYHAGLISDPFTVGWCTVAHSLSDLAAVSAEPVGVLLSVTVGKNNSAEWAGRFFDGAHAALERHRTFCLGGDTSFGAEGSFTCTSVGRVCGHKPLTRIGAGPRDSLYVTGPLGSGNLLGIAKHADPKQWEILEGQYLPVARLAEGQTLSGLANCAIDTSDALLQAVTILAALNKVGVDLFHRPEIYDSRVTLLAGKVRFPLWLANAFGLGEHELLFSIHKSREVELARCAAQGNFTFLKVGETSPEPGIRLHMDGKAYLLDAEYLLNLFSTCSSLAEYMQRLVDYDTGLHQSR